MKNTIKYLLLILSAFLLMFFIPKSSNKEWKIDKEHSKISFSVTHLLISEVEGLFHDFDGEVLTSHDNWINPKINISIKTASIDTDSDERDNHLKSDDFFDVKKFPEIKFQSTSMKPLPEKNLYKLKGLMTIKKVTKEVELLAKFGGQIEDPQDGMTKVGFKLSGDIDRYDFGLKWNISPATEITAVDNIVHLECFIRLERPTVLLSENN